MNMAFLSNNTLNEERSLHQIKGEVVVGFPDQTYTSSKLKEFRAMGSDHTKPKSAKAQSKPVVSRGKSLDDTKNVLLLYKASSENEKMSDVVDHFCDALNQVKPPGCVAIESKNAVNLFEQDEQNIRSRTSQWLANPNCVVIVLCLGEDDPSRECFTDESGTVLPNKIFPVCFGTLEWPESYSLGLANPEKIERPNDFEGAGLDTLVAAIRGT